MLLWNRSPWLAANPGIVKLVATKTTRRKGKVKASIV
jgi:hypothetical protein